MSFEKRLPHLAPLRYCRQRSDPPLSCARYPQERRDHRRRPADDLGSGVKTRDFKISVINMCKKTKGKWSKIEKKKKTFSRQLDFVRKKSNGLLGAENYKN